MTHYDTLGVGRRAPAAEIAAAATSLRAAVVLDHDRDGYMLAAIDEAEFVLTDADRRRVYDRTLPREPTGLERAARGVVDWRSVRTAALGVVPIAVIVGCVAWLLTRSVGASQLAAGVTLTVGLLGVVGATTLVAVRAAAAERNDSEASRTPPPPV